MKTLVLTWIALMALLCATALASLLPMGAANALVNIAIAAAKTVLVAMFFMHLRHSIPLLRIAATVGLAMLSLLFILSGADFLTRHIARSAWQGDGSGATAAAEESGHMQGNQEPPIAGPYNGRPSDGR